ncbi:MAG: DUF3488 and transglutaminase-like domain-containing protein [Thermodesulfovibrionales bacterium]|nr:DUF3488 and transglutaminase-like domain-containing protein [Thermodesulfovibrionales bacterium]
MTLKNDPVFTVKVKDLVKIITYFIGMTGFLSVYRHISMVYSLFFVILGIASIYLEHRKSFYLPRWVLNVTALTVILFSIYRLNPEDLVTPVAEGLLILLGIKFLEDKKFRDYMQIYAISLFLLSSAALLSVDIIFSVYLVILIFLLAISMVMLAYYSQKPDLQLTKDIALKIVFKSLLIPLISIPMTLFLFIVMPRTSNPLLDFLNKPGKARTGFSDNFSLGDVTGIQEDNSVIFRANMEKTDENLLYWRGIVLDRFDGTSWRQSGQASKDTVRLAGKKIKQTIFLEPYENKYIFALDKPETIFLKDAKVLNSIIFYLPKDIDRRIRYEAISVLSNLIYEEKIDEDRYLHLPDNISDEIKKLTKNLVTGKEKETGAKVILTYLNSGQYKYSLKNLPLTKKPLDDFLFKYNYGNCEYFASAMTVMLRIAEIPSRIVGGYKGGYYNEIGNYYLVLQKNAHVWVEAYLNKKWTRFDPTPTSTEGFASSPKRNTLFKLKLLMDAINYHWNAFVINYDFEKQIALFSKIKLGLKRPDINLSGVRKYSFIIVIGAVTAFIGYFLFFNKNPVEKRLISSLLRKMARLGYKRHRAQGLEEFLLSISDKRLKQRAEEFVQKFEKRYYRDESFTKEEIKRLKDMLKYLTKK